MTYILPDLQPKTIDLFEDGNAGLFEINDAGTVLYCRTAAKLFSEKSSAAVGLNFFAEAAPFENAEELRRRFDKFISSGFSSEKFNFTCRKNDRNIPAKIMLLRVSGRENNRFDKTTILDIRKI